jgi:hypothetical protein
MTTNQRSYENDHLDFTEKHYREILRAAKSKEEVRLIGDYSDEIKKGIFFRHDLDLGTERAVAISDIEKEEGVKATYYILLHSQFYNLLERSHHDNILKIIANGHDIGLHFDCSFYDIADIDQLERSLLFEKGIIEQLYGITVRSFSFHINNSFTLSCRKPKYAGLINAYSNALMHDSNYVSDSYGVWRFSRIIDVINQPAKPGIMQVLTHPEWWFENATQSNDKIEYHIARRRDLMLETAEKYYMIEHAHKRVN